MPAELEQGRQELTPSREIKTSDGYRFFIFDETQTILPHVCLEDPGTGFIVSTTLANPDLRVAAIKAWSGARHSRSPWVSWEILHQMLLDSVSDADSKMDSLFRQGHASIGDMAPIGVHIERVPMHACLAIFNNLSLNSGQEKSTRFQMAFSEAPLYPIASLLREDIEPALKEEIEARYQGLHDLAASLFAESRDKIYARFSFQYAPETREEEKTVTARTLDTARVFLLLGQLTGQFVEDSARNWARLIGEMKASPNVLYQSLGLQIQRLLAPKPEEEAALGFKAEAPSLIRHAETALTANTNLAQLKYFFAYKTDLLHKVHVGRQFKGEVGQKAILIPRGYSAPEKMIAQYLLSLWPGLDKLELMSWVSSQPEARKREISSSFFAGHDNYHELPSWAATTEQTLIFDASLAEVRDLNRHRGLTRFIEIPAVFGLKMDYDTFVQILSKGYVLPAYLTEIPDFADLKKHVETSLIQYYEKLYGLLKLIDSRLGTSFDYSALLNVLPLGHRVPIWLHGNPKQFVYMPSQRIRPGGQINYRILAWEGSQQIANSDPYLEGLRLKDRPDPASRKEFFERS